MSEVQIGFFDTGSTSGLNYYPVVASYTEPTRLTLVDETNAATQIEISQTQDGALGVGTAVEPGISLPDFADELEGSYFFSDSGSVANWTFWNMPAGTHQLVIFASRGAVAPRSADFAFGTDTGSLDAAENTSTTLTLSYTATEGEDVVFTFGRSAGSTFGYLNVVRLILEDPSTVTQTDTTPEDGVLQTFNTTGLTSPITAASLGGTDILALLSDTDPTTATTYTLDVSATELSTGMPRIGETSTLSVTATGGTATTDVVIQPKTNWIAETLAPTLVKGVDDYLTLADSTLSITTAVGNINYYNNARGEVITPQGVYTGGTTTPFQSTEFVIQQGGSATTTATSVGGLFYPFGQGAGSGPIVTTRISSSAIVSEGITSSSI